MDKRSGNTYRDSGIFHPFHGVYVQKLHDRRPQQYHKLNLNQQSQRQTLVLGIRHTFILDIRDNNHSRLGSHHGIKHIRSPPQHHNINDRRQFVCIGNGQAVQSHR